MAQVATYAMPSRIYRYRNIDDQFDRELEAIEQGYVYCSRFDKLNDPMEGLHRESALFRKSLKRGKILSMMSDERSKLC